MSDTPEFRPDPAKASKEPHPEFVREDDGADLPGLGEETPEFVREDEGDDLPGVGGHPDFELDPGKIDNVPDAAGAVPLQPARGASAERPGGAASSGAPWWRVPLIAVGVIGVVIGVLAATSGGGETGKEAAPPKRQPTSAPAAGFAGPDTDVEFPTITALDATFDPATYSTTYAVAATDPSGRALTYQWSWTPEEECGRFTTDGPTAVWAHPHKSQANEPGVRALGLDEADLCEDSAQTAGGHRGTISIHVSNGQAGAFGCQAHFPEGSNEYHVTRSEGPACGPVPTSKSAVPRPAG